MNQENRDTVQIVFFSGTGGTKRVADSFEKELIKRDKKVEVKSLGAGDSVRSNHSSTNSSLEDISLYILLYPVYAFDAPKPIYNWIESLGEQEEGKQIAVISVSGGGEVWPNTGCRNNCCEKLEKKGLKIIYDNMMCMPANMLTEMNDHVVMHLIKVIPEKVNKALDQILSGTIQRTRFHKSALRNYLSNLENKNASKFAKNLLVTDDCTCCRWCAKNCTTNNIIINEQTKKPTFLDQCTICLRCVYGCPAHAIQAKSKAVLKSFDLDAIEKRMEGVELDPVEKCCKGIVFSGVRDYLLGKY